MTTWVSFGEQPFTVTNLFTFDHANSSGSAAGNAEVVAHSAAIGAVFATGGVAEDDVAVSSGLDILDGGTGALLGALDLIASGAVNSVAVRDNADGSVTVAVAIGAPVKTDPGTVQIFTVARSGQAVTVSDPTTVTVGANPDQLVFTPDGATLLVADEGEPSGYGEPGTVDPEGAVTLIDVATGTTRTATFTAFNDQADALRAEGVRLFGPGASVAQDLEPEYIAISPDGATAWVTLQENNALAILDIASATITDIVPLGLKDHSVPGQGIDPSDRDGGFSTETIRTVPVFGMYMPDGIAAFEFGGETFLITANEGDARDWPGLSEETRVNDDDYVLDPTVFGGAEAIEALKENDQLGRLTVTLATGDTDGDGDFDEIHAFGGRSVTIWNDEGGLVWDSGDAIEQALAEFAPQLVDDGRSDNKGPEPESVVVGEVDGETYAFVTLERSNPDEGNMIMVFRLQDDGAGSPEGVALGVIATQGDNAPEVIDFAADGPGGRPALYIPNEVSGTTTAVALGGNFTLQILHHADFEGNTNAIGDAPRLAALFDHFDDLYVGNTLKLSGGDNWIPSPWYNAQSGADAEAVLLPALQAVYENLLGLEEGSLTGLELSPGVVDQAILNIIGLDVSAIGNHEFDQGPDDVARILEFRAAAGEDGVFQIGEIQNIGALYPTISANLDFAANADLADAFTDLLRAAEAFTTTGDELSTPEGIAGELPEAGDEGGGKKLANYTTIEIGGETIGFVGATTQRLAGISSPGTVGVEGGPVDDMALLAAILQDDIDVLRDAGIDKIILQSHLQTYTLEAELATLLEGVDIILSAGSDAIFANPSDVIKPGPGLNEPTYPLVHVGADGAPVLQINTDGQYNYLGRLVVEFDEDGRVIVDRLNTTDPAAANYSGAFATTDAVIESLWGEDDPYAEGTLGGAVRSLTDGIDALLGERLANVEGYTEVFLNGLRGAVRNQETNLGNLTADANLAHGRQFLEANDTGAAPAPLVSLKNGGGIRAEIGLPLGVEGPEAPPNGEVNQLGIETSLAFNNLLVVVQSSAAGLLALLEHGVANAGTTQGRFPQIGGLQFSYDISGVPGDRIQSLVLVDEAGDVLDVVVADGELQGDGARPINIVTLNFLAETNGDGYPFDLARRPGTTDIPLYDPTAEPAYDLEGSEQDAFADFLNENHGTPETAFDQEDTPQALDERIQNLAQRADSLDAILDTTFFRNLGAMYEPGTEYGGAATGVQIDGATQNTRFTRNEGDASITRFDFDGGASFGDGGSEVGAVTWTDDDALLAFRGNWGKVKTAVVDEFTGASLTVENFLEAVVLLGDDSDAGRDVTVLGAMRGIVETAGGDDVVRIEADSQMGGGWVRFLVDTGAGDDEVTVVPSAFDYTATCPRPVEYREWWTKSVVNLGEGDDRFTGGGSIDHIVYAGARSEYAIEVVDGVTTVIDLVTEGLDEGTDTLVGADRLRFSDATLAWTGSGWDLV